MYGNLIANKVEINGNMFDVRVKYCISTKICGLNIVTINSFKLLNKLG